MHMAEFYSALPRYHIRLKIDVEFYLAVLQTANTPKINATNFLIVGKAVHSMVKLPLTNIKFAYLVSKSCIPTDIIVKLRYHG